MYRKDDIVTYGTQGVCKIAAITEKNFDGSIHEYYKLVPVYDEKSTLFVPVGNTALTERMHRVLSAEDIDALIQSMPSEKPSWIENETERKQKYKEILDSGDRKALIRAIKALYYYKKKRQAAGKKIHVCDEHFLRDAERVLYDEFAFVLKIDRSKIPDYIINHAEQTEPA